MTGLRRSGWTYTRLIGLGTAVLLLAPALALAQTSTVGGTTVQIRRSPRIILRYPPVIIVPAPSRQEQSVRVEFDARGTEWGAVYLNDRLLYRPHNFDRRSTHYLPPGGYRLEITGVVRSDVWASGYLDLGRDSSRVVVVRFSKTEGVSVSGGPYVWIPD